MPHILEHSPLNARGVVVTVPGEDGIARPRTVLEQTPERVFVYSKRDRKHIGIHKAELLPPGMWDLHEYLTAAAELEGCTPEELIRRLRDEAPELLRAARTLDALCEATAPAVRP